MIFFGFETKVKMKLRFQWSSFCSEKNVVLCERKMETMDFFLVPSSTHFNEHTERKSRDIPFFLLLHS